MNLADITRPPLVTLTVDDHCRRAAELMKEFHIRHLPVVDQEVPVIVIFQLVELATSALPASCERSWSFAGTLGQRT